MKAVLLNGITPAEEVALSEVRIPEIRPGWVLVKVKAFGMNHSEKILRLQEIENAYIQKPVIPGIECVGEIAHPSDSHFQRGQKVVALMGGMGREFHGSYAEYAHLPRPRQPTYFWQIPAFHGRSWRRFRKHILPPGVPCLNACI